MICRPPPKRLQDGERTVEEAVLGSDQLDVDAVSSQLPEREHCLEACDTSTEDEHAVGR